MEIQQLLVNKFKMMLSIWKENCKKVSIFFLAAAFTSVTNAWASMLGAFILADLVLFCVIRFDARKSNWKIV